jgi:hypothetical protein
MSLPEPPKKKLVGYFIPCPVCRNKCGDMFLVNTKDIKRIEEQSDEIRKILKIKTKKRRAK